ncbi:sigma-70 family RNA polymerase sigma factor [Streptomyces sp. NBC_00057]|uniref:sigma-70 family RNA polymerase sigma factor n=1 Tax=Streptomyces sp. NBC_00057 TaxID=2975634 RepID=UPI0032464AD6
MAVELKTSVAVLYRNLQQAAKQGVVPLSAFEAETAALALDGTARARLISALSELGLRLETTSVAATPTDDSGEVKKVVGPRTENPQMEGRLQPRVNTALRLLGRYATERAVTERAVTGVSRLTGLTASEAADLRAGAAARFSLLVAEPQAARTRPSDMTMPEPESPTPPPPARDSAPLAGDLAAAIAAAQAVIEEDRRTKRPEKRILTALEEVGLSVLLRGGPRYIAVEPTAEELRSLPATDIRRRARDCLALHNQGLAWSQVRAHVGQGLDEDDLFQHGMLGILRAIRKFDPSHGNKFSTYATWWVRQSITRALADEGSTIRIPVHMHELVRKVGRAERDLMAAGRSRSAAAVAVSCDLPVSKVEEIRRISKVTDSTDRIIGDSTHLGELLEARTSLPSVEVAVMAALADEEAHALVALLPERYARVVTLRVGLDGEDPATLDVIGGELGITRERVRQLESQVFAVLRVAFKDPAGNPHAALSSMLADARGDGTANNPVGAISRDLGTPDWRAGIRALTAFRAREGRAMPGPNHVEDGFALGKWVTQQRMDGQAGGHGLPAHRRILLDTVGMVWAAPRPDADRRRPRRALRRAVRATGPRHLARPATDTVPAPAPTGPETAAAEPVAPTAQPDGGAAAADETALSVPSGNPVLPTGPAPVLPAVRDTAPAFEPLAPPDTAPEPPPVLEQEIERVAVSAPADSGTHTPPSAGHDQATPDDTPAEGSEASIPEVSMPEVSAAERYAGRWGEAIALSITLNRSVRWMAHYVHLALGHVLLSEILGLHQARAVAEVAEGGKLPDRPVGQALEVLVRVVDGLKDGESRPEDFFESPSPALLGRSPREYLAAYPLTKPEARLALTDALKGFSPGPEPRPATIDEDPVGGPAAATDTTDDTALREALAAADEAAQRFRELEADVADRVARARAAERNHARAQAQVDAYEAERRFHKLETSVAEQVANARAEERNRALAESQTEAAQQIARIRRETEQLVREADMAAEERVQQAKASMDRAAADREERALRHMEEEIARRARGVEETARRQVLALEARLRQAEAAFTERARAAQAMEQEATERVRAVERWAELRVAEVEHASRSRIAELEAQLAPVHDTTPPPSPAGPQQPDPRRWWRRG